MKRKTRKQKAMEYEEKFSHIPIDFNERLSWLYDTLKISETDAHNILMSKYQMMDALRYTSFNVVLFEVPEGSPRPRFRIVNRANIANMAISNPNFVHVYSPVGHEDNVFMKRLMTEGELTQLNSLICTPCVIEINAFLKTPSYYNKQETILAEIGLDRPFGKPDWDNIAKKYCDMFNANVWLDDSLVMSGTVNKFYSVLPRIEIHLHYLNMLYNKHQYKSMLNRMGDLNATPQYFSGVDYNERNC